MGDRDKWRRERADAADLIIKNKKMLEEAKQ